jgi:hypothetical protein
MAHNGDGTRTSQGGNGVPNPPPVPPNLAEAMVALVNATAENARLLREMAQHNQMHHQAIGVGTTTGMRPLTWISLIPVP